MFRSIELHCLIRYLTVTHPTLIYFVHSCLAAMKLSNMFLYAVTTNLQLVTVSCSTTLCYTVVCLSISPQY
jgi:hypothetical protein